MDEDARKERGRKNLIKILSIAVVGAVIYGVSGYIGNSIGPGYKDLLQGLTGLVTLAAIGIAALKMKKDMQR